MPTKANYKNTTIYRNCRRPDSLNQRILRKRRKHSPVLVEAIGAAEANAAIQSIATIKKASRRGDRKASEALLACNRLTKEEWSQAKRQGGAQINVVMSIPGPGQDVGDFVVQASFATVVVLPATDRVFQYFS